MFYYTELLFYVKSLKSEIKNAISSHDKCKIGIELSCNDLVLNYQNFVHFLIGWQSRLDF